MDSKDTKEYTMDDLEDIIREYSSRRLPNLKEELPADETLGSDTVRLGPATAQTVRLGSAPEKTVRLGESWGIRFAWAARIMPICRRPNRSRIWTRMSASIKQNPPR